MLLTNNNKDHGKRFGNGESLVNGYLLGCGYGDGSGFWHGVGEGFGRGSGAGFGNGNGEGQGFSLDFGSRFGYG
jgi:hypothetical protein